MEWFNHIQNYISELGLFGVFMVMVIENLGIPFPTEVGFIVAQGLIIKGTIDYFDATLIITAGHIFGAVLAYYIGYWGGSKLNRHLQNNAKWLLTKERITGWYKRWGSITIFVTRNFGYVRPWSSLVAGFAKMPFAPFLLWTAIGSFVFSFVSLTVTKYLVVIWRDYPQLHILISIIMGFLFFGLIGAEFGKQIYAKFHRKK